MYVIESRSEHLNKKTGQWVEHIAYFSQQSWGCLNQMVLTPEDARQFETLTECRRFIRLNLSKRYKPIKLK